MYTYLKLLFDICLFKKGPQDIPHSALLFRLSIIGFVIFNYLLIQLSVDGIQALLQLGVEFIIVVGFTALVLSFSHKLKRFIQTSCALIGTDALLSFFAMPILATLSLDNNNILAFFAMLALIIWNWLVTTHIIRHAINQSFSFAAGIVFLYIYSTYQIMAILFPAISTPA